MPTKPVPAFKPEVGGVATEPGLVMGWLGRLTSLAGRLELNTGIAMGVFGAPLLPPRPREPQSDPAEGSRIATRCTVLSSLGVNCSSIASTGTSDIFSEDCAGNVIYYIDIEQYNAYDE